MAETRTIKGIVIQSAAAVVGAGFFLLVFDDWWTDGFAMGMAGMLIGQFVGFRIARWPCFAKGSDAPFVFVPQLGIGVMIIFWLCLPTDSVTLLGYMTKAIDGAALGYMMVEGARIKSQIWAARQERDSADSAETHGPNE
jgi:hypothetical protein